MNGAFCDQNVLAPKLVYTSYIPRIPILKMLDDIQADSVKPVYRMNIANKGIHLAPYHALDSVIPPKAKDMVEKAKQQMIDKELILGTDFWETAVKRDKELREKLAKEKHFLVK